MNHTCWKVSDTWHGGRENLIFRPEPGVPPRLDDPRYSSYQFDGDTIPGTGRDSSFVVLRALIGGECYYWRNGKIRINKDSGDPVISFQRFSRMIGSRKAEFLKISSKSRIFAAADNRNEIRPLQKIPLPSRALAWARRLLWSASSRVSAQSFSPTKSI